PLVRDGQVLCYAGLSLLLPDLPLRMSCQGPVYTVVGPACTSPPCCMLNPYYLGLLPRPLDPLSCGIEIVLAHMIFAPAVILLFFDRSGLYCSVCSLLLLGHLTHDSALLSAYTIG